jgi:5-formyltetrahydrofolate cyclo-ligase
MQKRADLSFTEIEILSSKITSLFLKTFPFSQLKISCFAPIQIKKEVNTIPLINALCEKNHVYLPVSNFMNSSMSHWRYQPGDLLIENRYGIPEPKQRHLSLESEFFDVIIVPVLAMDIYGNRLGYGKGYYDRFIATCRPNIITIGLHFFEPLADLPIEPNDMPLTYLVTPNKYYAF